MEPRESLESDLPGLESDVADLPWEGLVSDWTFLTSKLCGSQSLVLIDIGLVMRKSSLSHSMESIFRMPSVREVVVPQLRRLSIHFSYSAHVDFETKSRSERCASSSAFDSNFSPARSTSFRTSSCCASDFKQSIGTEICC